MDMIGPLGALAAHSLALAFSLPLPLALALTVVLGLALLALLLAMFLVLLGGGGLAPLRLLQQLAKLPHGQPLNGLHVDVGIHFLQLQKDTVFSKRQPGFVRLLRLLLVAAINLLRGDAGVVRDQALHGLRLFLRRAGNRKLQRHSPLQTAGDGLAAEHLLDGVQVAHVLDAQLLRTPSSL